MDGKTLLVEFQGTKHSWDREECVDCCNRRRMDAIAWLKAGVWKLKRSGKRRLSLMLTYGTFEDIRTP